MPNVDAVRVAIVDDDAFRAAGMELLLRRSVGLEVVLVTDQDAVLRTDEATWREVDVALVDVVDETAPGEVGTDTFSGIAAIEHIRRFGVRTVAIVPRVSNPVVDLRLVQSGTEFVYRSDEMQTVVQLEEAILRPDADHHPVAPSVESLEALGAHRARPNESVREYERSRLHGLVRADTEVEELPMNRNTLSKFRVRIRRTGFSGTEQRGGRVLAPRWPDVRAYLLRALGRDPEV